MVLGHLTFNFYIFVKQKRFFLVEFSLDYKNILYGTQGEKGGFF